MISSENCKNCNNGNNKNAFGLFKLEVACVKWISLLRDGADGYDFACA